MIQTGSMGYLLNIEGIQILMCNQNLGNGPKGYRRMQLDGNLRTLLWNFEETKEVKNENLVVLFGGNLHSQIELEKDEANVLENLLKEA